MSESSDPQQRDGAGAVPDYKYWAFISYSHRDEAWAGWLHRSIETYRIPALLRLSRPEFGTLPRRFFPVFRDRDELAGAADLGGRIRDALERSRFLIVICSRQSAASRWVNEEIRTFKALGRADRVLCLIIDGEPWAAQRAETAAQECFPPAVRFHVDADGTISSRPAEPLASDARPGKDGRRNAFLKLLAGMLDVGLDSLKRRDAQRRFWASARWATFSAAVFAAIAAGYVSLAARGSTVVGGEATRTLLDRYEVNWLRPVHSDKEVRRAAATLRQALVGRLAPVVRESVARAADGDTKVSIWLTTQAVAALLRAPETPPDLLDDCRRALEIPFLPGVPIVHKEINYGWIPSGDATTMAEPALWTAMALGLALSRPGLLDKERSTAFRKQLEFAQEATRLFRPLADGGWNTFPLQKDPAQHSTYTSALGLLVLLQMRDAGLPWENEADRDDLAAATAGWLVRQYEKADPPGWRIAPGRTSVADALTLQVYGALLRAHTEAVFELPAPIRGDIPEHLVRLTGRPLNYPNSTGYFFVEHRTHDTHQPLNQNPGTECLWYPWGIECAWCWLHSEDARRASNETRVRVRRALGSIIVDLSPELLEHIAGARPPEFQTFEASELLFVLSGIPGLDD